MGDVSTRNWRAADSSMTVPASSRSLTRQASRPRTVRRVLREQGIAAPRKQRQSFSVSRPSWPDGDDQFDVEWLRRRYVVQHRTLAAIASEAHVSISTVHTALRAHGLRRSMRRQSASALDDEQWLRLRYIDDGATAVDIAAEIGVSPKRVRSAQQLHHGSPGSDDRPVEGLRSQRGPAVRSLEATPVIAPFLIPATDRRVRSDTGPKRRNPRSVRHPDPAASVEAAEGHWLGGYVAGAPLQFDLSDEQGSSGIRVPDLRLQRRA